MKLAIGVRLRTNVKSIRDFVLFQVGYSVGFIKNGINRIWNTFKRSILNLSLLTIEFGKYTRR